MNVEVAIVGNGVAGFACAVRIARHGIRPLLIGPGLPVDRPPLTKKALATGVPTLLSDEQRLAERGVERLDGTVVEADLTGRRLRTDDGDEIEADTVVLATGLRYSPPPVPGSEAALVNADPAALGRIAAVLAEPGRRVVVIGAGLVGTESAATLAGAGHDVTALDVLERPLDRLHDPLPSVGAAALAATGARFLGNVSLTGLVENGDGRVTLCHSGGSLAADLVLAATGGRPRVPPGLDVVEADLPLEVDGALRVPGLERVHAVGDLIVVPHARFGPMRFPHWDMAVGTGEHAADAIAGLAGDLDRLPYWWTDIGPRTFAEVGWAEAVVEWADENGIHVGRGLGGEPAAALVVDEPRRLREARALLGYEFAPMSTASELPSLRLDATREDALERAAAIVAGAWQSFDRARPGQPTVDERLHELLRAALPENGASALAALDDAAQLLDMSIAQPRPRFFAFVGSSGLEIGVLGDLLASCFDVNLAVWAGAASEVEDQAVRWVSEFVGFPAAAGAFTSGGTISNVTALAAARERALPGSRRNGMTGARAALYCSREAHYSVVRAAELLGIGSDQVRALEMDELRRLRPVAVADAIDADRAAGVVPVAAVATAGTTLTGAVDPIDALADVCASRGVWLHVDGAYGVAAASTPSAAHLFAGLDRADSVTLDAHKWLFLPKACGVVLVRRHEHLHGALAHEEDYIPHERPDHHMVDITLEYSRPFRALKLWLAFRAHGAEAIRAAVERNLRQARLLYAEVARREELEHLCGVPQLSIVPFRHVPSRVPEDELDEHNALLVEALQQQGDVWVAPARVDGRVCLRPCVVNYRTTDADVRALVEVVLDVGASVVR